MNFELNFFLNNLLFLLVQTQIIKKNDNKQMVKKKNRYTSIVYMQIFSNNLPLNFKIQIIIEILTKQIN